MCSNECANGRGAHSAHILYIYYVHTHTHTHTHTDTHTQLCTHTHTHTHTHTRTHAHTARNGRGAHLAHIQQACNRTGNRFPLSFSKRWPLCSRKRRCIGYQIGPRSASVFSLGLVHITNSTLCSIGYQIGPYSSTVS